MAAKPVAAASRCTWPWARTRLWITPATLPRRAVAAAAKEATVAPVAPGGTGGQGSAYAATTIGAGSNGGAGGGGGPGGPGAGGEGGPSYAIAGGGSVELGTGVLEEVARRVEVENPAAKAAARRTAAAADPQRLARRAARSTPRSRVQLPSVVTFPRRDRDHGWLPRSLHWQIDAHRQLRQTSCERLGVAAKHGGHVGAGRLSFSLPREEARQASHPPEQGRAQAAAGGEQHEATLTVELKLGKAKKTKRTQAIELVGPAASKPAKAE